MKEILENLFSSESNWDNKHINNVCNNPVSEAMLDQIEKGCSLESIEQLVEDGFPVFKYRTQLTIHGIFPKVTTNRIGQYKNLIQNKNKSIGVRWSAVDNSKRNKLMHRLCAISDFRYYENSSEHLFYISKRLGDDIEQNKAIAMELVNRAKSIDTSLFYGDVNVVRLKSWISEYIELRVNLRAFHCQQYNEIVSNFSGKSIDVWTKEYDEYCKREIEEKQKRIAEWEKMQEERKIAAAENQKQYEIWLQSNNPGDGYVNHAKWTPEIAQVAKVIGNYKTGFRFKYGKVSKSFGKLNLKWDDQCKGSRIKGNLLDIWVISDKPKEEPKKSSDVKIVEYTEKQIAVIGNTYPLRSELKRLGGNWNKGLSIGCGWIFPKSKLNQVKELVR